jgi:ribosomal protein L20
MDFFHGNRWIKIVETRSEQTIISQPKVKQKQIRLNAAAVGFRHGMTLKQRREHQLPRFYFCFEFRRFHRHNLRSLWILNFTIRNPKFAIRNLHETHASLQRTAPGAHRADRHALRLGSLPP